MTVRRTGLETGGATLPTSGGACGHASGVVTHHLGGHDVLPPRVLHHRNRSSEMRRGLQTVLTFDTSEVLLSYKHISVRAKQHYWLCTLYLTYLDCVLPHHMNVSITGRRTKI